MESFRRGLLLFLLPIFFFSCQKKQLHVSRAYYFWRTSDPSNEERKFLKSHSISKVYFHLLDVDWSDVFGAMPVAGNEPAEMNHEMKVYDSFPVQIVPVVFITNKTFERIDSLEIPLLAKRIVRRCLPAFDEVDMNYERNHSLGWSDPVWPAEIQFDCDWTEKTAGKYFSFLREAGDLVRSRGMKLSATIRLHQFRYFKKTGVPPVNRGMLMVYNISDPKQYSEKNSIFEEAATKDYFTNEKDYPLPLDIVLPAWSWCIIYRDKKFYQIENELDENDLRSASFLKAEGHHIYLVTADTVYHDLFLRPGDEIKAEGIDEHSLEQAAALAKKAINTDSFTVSFFELSEKEIKNYKNEIIDKVYSSFH